MELNIGAMTSTLRPGEGSEGDAAAVVAAVLAAVRRDAEHGARVHAERWIPCCAACAEAEDDE